MHCIHNVYFITSSSVTKALSGDPDPFYADKVSDYTKISEYTFCERIRRNPNKYRNIRETIRQRLSDTRNKIIGAIFSEVITSQGGDENASLVAKRDEGPGNHTLAVVRALVAAAAEAAFAAAEKRNREFLMTERMMMIVFVAMQ